MEFLEPLRDAIVEYYDSHAQHPQPEKLPLRYGTAGFRTMGSLLPPVAARVLLVAVIRSLQRGASVGIMITASHNPAEDNGIKLVDTDGGMLDQRWEALCTAVANTRDGAPLYAALEAWVREERLALAIDMGIDADSAAKAALRTGEPQPIAARRARLMEALKACPYPLLHIARDTRVSGPDMVHSITHVLDYLLTGLPYVNHGILTTPQLHTMVFLQNHPGPLPLRLAQATDGVSRGVPCEADYYTLVLDGLEKLLGFIPPSPGATEAPPPKLQVLVVDASNGVGALKLRALLAASHARGKDRDVLGNHFRVVILNDHIDGGMLLNKQCGADFCQREKKPSEAMRSWNLSKLVEHDRSCNGVNIPVEDEVHYYALDGDADRLVAFHRTPLPADEWRLLDGDRIAILYTLLLRHYIQSTSPSAVATVRGDDLNLDIGIVQTAYANGASTQFVEKSLHIPTFCAATGVKNVHSAAHERDCGVYFEANGHGTMLIKPKVIQRYPPLGPLSHLLSQVCGDALGDMLACEVALATLGHTHGKDQRRMTFQEWLNLYTDLPSIQSKVVVRDPSVIRNTPDERRVLSPPGLQEEVDAAVRNAYRSMTERCQQQGKSESNLVARAFVRPSGTEPIVRVYAEASMADVNATLAAEVEEAVRRFC